VKPETKQQLTELLDKQNQRKREAKAQASAQQNAEAKNLADFSAKKKELIGPALREIANLYKENGTSIEIREEDERPNDKGGILSPYISLDMSGQYPGRSLPSPEFRLNFEKRTRNVSLYTSTGSMAGSAGSVTLDTITTDWIQEAFVKYQRGG